MINLSKREPRAIARFGGIFSCSCSCYLVPFGHMSPDVSLVLRYTVVSMSHVISAGTKGQHIRPLWPLLRLGSKIMLLRMGLLLRLGSKCYYGWDFYYAWVQMFITDGTFITLGSSYYTGAFNSPSCQSESNAFLKFTKHAYTFVLWQLTYLSINVRPA